MEEHFVLRVPPDVAARLRALLAASSSSAAADAATPDLPLDLAFHGTPSPRQLLLLPAAACRSAARACRLSPRPRLPAEDGRSGTFTVGNLELPAYLLDLPCVVESFKTYDDNTLIKTADVGQMIVVQRPEDAPPQGPECRHGLTPPMRDARRRRFRRDPDLDVSTPAYGAIGCPVHLRSNAGADGTGQQGRRGVLLLGC
eukprot:SM000042S15279  [mRNA]  locus=s42:50232:51358:+ [translate_table: standard]